jgi:hypothetical protein
MNKYLLTHIVYLLIITTFGFLFYRETQSSTTCGNSPTLRQLVIDKITDAQNANLQPDEIEEYIGLSAHYSTIRPQGADRINGSYIVFEDGSSIRLKEYDNVAIWFIPGEYLEYLIVLWKDGHATLRKGKQVIVG